MTRVCPACKNRSIDSSKLGPGCICPICKAEVEISVFMSGALSTVLVFFTILSAKYGYFIVSFALITIMVIRTALLDAVDGRFIPLKKRKNEA